MRIVRRRAFDYLSTISAIVLAGSAAAQWQDRGALGPKSMAVDTLGHVYVGALLNIYKSTDGGATFPVLTDNVELSDCFSIAVNPLNNNVVIAVESGVYRSANGGQNWTKLSLELVGAYAIKCRKDGLLIAAGSSGVLRSIDNGETWTRTLETIGPLGNGLTFSKNGTAFVATLLDGVYRSNDNGLTWQLSLGSPREHMNALDVAADTIGGAVYASLYYQFFNDPVYSIIYRSLDDGANWTAIDSSAGLVQSLIVDHQQRLIASRAPTAYSPDFGANWHDLSDGLPAPGGWMRAMLEMKPGVILGADDNLWIRTLPAGPGCCTGTRGNLDADVNDLVDGSDLQAIIDYIFCGLLLPSGCTAENDLTGDAVTDPSDLQSLVDYIFFNLGTPPPCP